MCEPPSTQSIVVGIDGSQAAINAAKWAAVEADSRDLPLFGSTAAALAREADCPVAIIPTHPDMSDRRDRCRPDEPHRGSGWSRPCRPHWVLGADGRTIGGHPG